MGTRAVIRYRRERIATHWDGDPKSLGADLLDIEEPTLEKVVKVASEHIIDCATKKVRESVSNERFEKIAAKANERYISQGQPPKYTIQDLKDLDKKGVMMTFGIMSAGDYPISPFMKYDDFAEFEYKYDKGLWLTRKLSGSYKEDGWDKSDDEWVPLTIRLEKELEARRDK